MFVGARPHCLRINVHINAEQVIELLGLLGFDWPRADAFRGALMRGRMGERIDHERYLRQETKKQGWTAEQADGLVALLLEHAGYLHSHGHSLAMAQHAFRQAFLKVSPATTPEFFGEVLNHGGS